MPQGKIRSDRIKELRDSRKLTQTDLATLVGVTLNAIYRYESGEAEPNSGTLAALADALGVSADYLLGRTDDPGGYFADTLTPEEAALIAEMRRHNAPGSMRLLADLLAKNG